MNIISLDTAWGENDIFIKIEHGEECLKVARDLSKYISNLPLSVEQNNRLVQLMIAQVEAAECGAFYQGANVGMEYGCYESQSDKTRENAK